MKIYEATTGHRNSYRYNFEATSEVSVTDCDGHVYIYTYIYTNARRLGRQVVASPSGSATNGGLVLNNFHTISNANCCHGYECICGTNSECKKLLHVDVVTACKVAQSGSLSLHQLRFKCTCHGCL